MRQLFKRGMFLWIAGWITLALPWFCAAFDLWPDTGQTTPAYSGPSDTFGKDGDYSINPQSYTKLGYGGDELPDTATAADGWIMTRDNVTGLTWEVKTGDGAVNDKSNTYTWCDKDYGTGFDYDSGECEPGKNMASFIDDLNTSLGFGGYTDWRMPTLEELLTIVNLEGDTDRVNTDFFPNTQASHYWSATTFAPDPYKAWTVEFFSGSNFSTNKSQMPGVTLKYHHLRAVRGGQTTASGYVDNGDGTVTDKATGLTWQQTGLPYKLALTEALEYCESLDLAGHTDWRLPNRNELLSLVDFSKSSPSIDTDYFPDTKTASYWSSSNHKGPSGNVGYWMVHFEDGRMDPEDNWQNYYVRAVRSDGAQSVPEKPVLMVSVTGNQVLIYWDPVANLDGYRLYFAPYPDAETVYSLDIDKNQAYLSYDLPSGTQMYLALKAYNGTGDSDFSNIEILDIP